MSDTKIIDYDNITDSFKLNPARVVENFKAIEERLVALERISQACTNCGDSKLFVRDGESRYLVCATCDRLPK